VPSKKPEDTASSILNALPGSSIASKTAILSAGAGISIAAISNELYVVNEESIVALSLLTIYWAVYNYAGPMYKEWAQGQSEKIKNILNAARDDHTSAVRARMDSVKDLGGVIDITKDLFAVSKVSHSSVGKME
jgi:F-type H+-transporting ATPase subunit b